MTQGDQEPLDYSRDLYTHLIKCQVYIYQHVDRSKGERKCGFGRVKEKKRKSLEEKKRRNNNH
ncbi:hypothetical protein Sjap_025279 [Stephania japonica]|uniref:Uncharacterized protein n=1 Tax=Stephania japonica TaxID=461633 RepID=A0AAP0HE32_9MAGN